MIVSFTSFCKKLDETLWLSFNILGGILFLVVVFVGLMFLIDFTTSILLTAEKENLYPLDYIYWIYIYYFELIKRLMVFMFSNSSLNGI